MAAWGDVAELDFATAPESDRRAMHEVLATWVVEDRPGAPPLPYEACVAAWQRRDDLGFGPPRFAVARVDGRIVGFAQVRLNDQEANAHLALVDVLVLARCRRRGIGTGLLRAALLLCGGRTTAQSWSVFKGSAGERFAAATGFRVFNAMTRQRVDLADPPEVDAVPAGYELRCWQGAAPDDVVETYVEALNAIADAPFGESAMALGQHTVASVRGDEAELAATGSDRWVVLALHGGAAAGVTAVERHPTRPVDAEQQETVVLPAHRGNGLGRVMKARLMRDLSGVERVWTRTSSDNRHMLRVNHSLGYTDQYTYLAVQAQIADLRL